ncbi:MAG: hypothetical protein H6618_09775 [Deltaproteobacteria bacterium]|nr:hypothetical protein [Deltaproteobacteria bacterium]
MASLEAISSVHILFLTLLLTACGSGDLQERSLSSASGSSLSSLSLYSEDNADSGIKRQDHGSTHEAEDKSLGGDRIASRYFHCQVYDVGNNSHIAECNSDPAVAHMLSRGGGRMQVHGRSFNIDVSSCSEEEGASFTVYISSWAAKRLSDAFILLN